MRRFSREIELEQRRVCELYKTKFVPCEKESKVGIALATFGATPINGLRHAQAKSTNGWYVWVGKELSSHADCFDPLHVEHLTDKCPEIPKFLGLPPGYRFLLAGNYVDVWFDKTLLSA